jgi:hypothetical protein
MALPVVTVASGGQPVVDVTALNHNLIGKAVTESLNGRGTAVTKVAASLGGMAVYYLVVKTDGSQHPK